MKKTKRITCRILSLVMALLLAVSSMVLGYAATTLKASNVTQWPTLSYKNGQTTIYYGQTLEEALIINDDEIVVDSNGVQVAGHFEFMKPALISTPGTNIKSNIKFVPDDTNTYTGFNKLFSSLTYNVEKVTPVFVDENNDPVVATKVEAGSMLSTSVLSGGKMTNPYNAEETNILNCTWIWDEPNTIVTESGYYNASFLPIGYNMVVKSVYVEVNTTIKETTVNEIPSISELEFDGTTKWGDLTLTGGIAVEKDTTNVVEGVFSIADNWKNKVVEVGTHEIDVTFTPNDTEAYSKAECKISVTVNKAPIRFVDENGNDIVPEITVPYGTKFNDISRLLRPFVKGADYTYFVMGDLSSKVCEDGTYTVKATAPDDGEHYEDTDLTFKIVVEKKKLNPKLYSATGKLYINDNSAVYHPTGTFTLEYTIDGVEQTPITGIKYNTHFDWNPTKSGNYEYTIIYNEAAEKEYFIIDDFTTNSTIALTWGFKATGSVEGTTYKYGSEVALEAPATDPTKEDKPFYGFVKWEDANGNTGLTEEELSNKEISFTMPDGDVELNATYKFDFCLCIRYYIQIVVDWFNSFFQSIGTLF